MANQINELEVQLHAARNPPEKVARLNALSEAVRMDDPERALALSQEAYWLAQDEHGMNHDPPGVADSALQMSRCHLRLGNFAQCLESALIALPIYAQGDESSRLGSTLDIVGISYTRLGSPAEGLEYHLRSLKMFEALGDRKGIATAKNGIAIVYENLGEHAKALDYFRQSLQISLECGDQAQAALVYANVALGYQCAGRRV